MLKELLGKEIVIVDDAIPQRLFDHLKKTMEGETWKFSAVTAIEGEQLNMESYSFGKTLPEDDPRFDLYLNVLFCGLSKAPQIPFDILLRIRLGMHTANHRNYINEPHVDLGEPHTTALLYINDSDGDTLIYNKQADFSGGPRLLDESEKQEFIPVSSKANRMIFFDGSYYHSSTRQTFPQQRMTVNYNFR